MEAVSITGRQDRERPEPLLLRPVEVAAMLGLGRSTVFDLIAARTIPSVKIGRAVRVPRAGLQRWLDELSDPAAPASTATTPTGASNAEDRSATAA